MTARRPAGAPGNAHGMIRSTDVVPGVAILQEMTFQAQSAVARREHLLINGSVRVMADGAPFPHGLMLEDIGPALCCMAAHASLIFREKGSASRFGGRALVGIVTITATHLGFWHWMVVRQFKLAPLVQVAFITVIRCAAWIDDGLALASGEHAGFAWTIISGSLAFTRRLNMKAGRPMAGLAAHVDCIGSAGLQPRMRGCWKVPCDVFMTLFTGFRADKCSSWYLWGDDDGALNRFT